MHGALDGPHLSAERLDVNPPVLSPGGRRMTSRIGLGSDRLRLPRPGIRRSLRVVRDDEPVGLVSDAGSRSLRRSRGSSGSRLSWAGS